MRDIQDKTDGTGDILAAEAFNTNLINELQDFVVSAGFTLDPEGGPDTDTAMFSKSVCNYSVGAMYFAESGAADAYVLTRSGNIEALSSYFDGAMVCFNPGNDNTGASTINVDGLGVKDLVAADGTALTGGEVVADVYCIARYNSSTDDFEIVKSAGDDAATLGGHPTSYFAVDSLAAHLAGTETLTGPKNFTGGATFNDAQVADIDLIAGINWTIRAPSVDNQWYSVTYGNGLFVAVAIAGSGNRVMTSPDGINWTIRTSAANNNWSSVCYGNGLFVSVAYSGTGDRVMTSPDGIVWTSRTSAADNDWRSVTYGNGLFVAVSNSGTGDRVMTSPDGITWTSRTSAADNEWRSVTYGNGLFVAVSSTGTGDRVMTSPDGITWTSRTSAADIQWFSVTYGNGLFVAVSSSGTGNRVMTSPDGITWTIRTSPADNQWLSVCYGNGMFVSVSLTGIGNRAMTSGKEEKQLEASPDHSHTHLAIDTTATADTIAARDSSGDITANAFESTVATGTAPLTVASTTLVSNLNADLLDGQQGSYYAVDSLVAHLAGTETFTGQKLFSAEPILFNNVSLRAYNTGATSRPLILLDSSDIVQVGSTAQATNLRSDGTLTYNGASLASGTFTTADAKTVTVVDGFITSIV